MALIEVKNLTKVYHDGEVETPALRGVSFDINEGEFVAIMGPSGSGKSTLLHILGFLDRHTSGTYRLDGKTIDDYSGEEVARVRNKKMGFIFQTFNLLRRTDVLENVKLPLLYSGLKPAEWDNMAMKALEAVGMTHRLSHEPSQLSGGEQQRAAIARAIVNSPAIIFADEPTGNLDSKSGGQVMETIENLHLLGHTIILITHETYTAEYAQRIIRLKDGEIESDQKITQQRHAADHKFVK